MAFIAYAVHHIYFALFFVFCIFFMSRNTQYGLLFKLFVLSCCLLTGCHRFCQQHYCFLCDKMMCLATV